MGKKKLNARVQELGSLLEGAEVATKILREKSERLEKRNVYLSNELEKVTEQLNEALCKNKREKLKRDDFDIFPTGDQPTSSDYFTMGFKEVDRLTASGVRWMKPPNKKASSIKIQLKKLEKEVEKAGFGHTLSFCGLPLSPDYHKVVRAEINEVNKHAPKFCDRFVACLSRGKATCHKNDDYHPNTGALIALGRAWKAYKKAGLFKDCITCDLGRHHTETTCYFSDECYENNYVHWMPEK